VQSHTRRRHISYSLNRSFYLLRFRQMYEQLSLQDFCRRRESPSVPLAVSIVAHHPSLSPADSGAAGISAANDIVTRPVVKYCKLNGGKSSPCIPSPLFPSIPLSSFRFFSFPTSGVTNRGEAKGEELPWGAPAQHDARGRKTASPKIFRD